MKMRDLTKAEILRHIADNLENGRDMWDGLIYWNGEQAGVGRSIDYVMVNCAVCLQPRTFTINDIELPAPMSEEPECDRIYFHLDPAWEGGYNYKYWEDSKADYSRLENGIWENEDDIKKVGEAIRGLR